MPANVGSFQLPLLTTAQRDAIQSPVKGLSVFNTDTNVTEEYSGTAWVPTVTTDTLTRLAFINQLHFGS